MDVELRDFVPLSELHKAPELVGVFGGPTGAEWFVRNYRTQLVASGAVIKLANQWRAHPRLFAQTALEIGKRRAKRSGE